MGKSELQMSMSQPEYMEFRCCMCPNISEPENIICPAGPMKTEATPCRFVKTYTDERGWFYQVMGGLGESNYNARYRKPGKLRWKCMANLPWRKSFDDAQSDLNALAKKKGWGEYPGVGV